nr:immunoglobulin heavy chain junction region [Homo sapiens]MBN4420397.1 immunoglobulin heavy chain junction region [Homo sapiens]
KPRTQPCITVLE